MREKRFQGYGFAVCTICIAMLASVPNTHADRGGWADPPGGWTFVEEWHSIPAFTDDPVWNHSNGSDEYSGNAHTAVVGEEVVRIDTIPGAGETEDGTTLANDARVLTLVDLGDPRSHPSGSITADPSDRKLYFLAPLHEAEFDVIPLDPFEEGVTFATRFRIAPMPLSKVILGTPPTGVADPVTWIPENSDRVHVGIGFVDPAVTALNVAIGVGYYEEGRLNILSNDMADPDGDENVVVLDGIDTTQFHTVWVTAQANPANLDEINVKAYANGSLTPVEAVVTRGTGAVDRPNPETITSPEWAGLPQLSINMGSAGTPSYGILQFDYIVANINGAFDPTQEAPVQAWELY